MRRFLFLLLFPFCIAHACNVTDDAGNVIHLSAPAKHIISLAPDLTELLFVAGAGAAVVGVTQGSDYPLAAQHIDVIGSYAAINSEMILKKHADLIVVWGASGDRQVAMLKKLGVPLFVSYQRKLEDIPQTLQKMGCLAGTETVANKAAQTFSLNLAQLKRTYGQRKKVKVFYKINERPLMTINRNSWINQAIELCGGENIFGDLSMSVPTVSLESVLLADPEVIIGSDKIAWQQHWEKWPELKAVKNHKLVMINPDLLERAGPRLIMGITKMCKAM